MLCLPFAATAETPAEVAAKLQEKYDKTRDLRADFSQVSVVKMMNMTREGSGRLVIKKPGMLKYTYDKPEKQTILVKDGQLIMHVPSANQVVIQKLETREQYMTPVAFLAGLGKITDSFVVSFPEDGPRDGDGNMVLKLVPKGAGMDVKQIVLTFDPETYDMRGFSFTDGNNNDNTIMLHDIRINEGVDASEFDFEIPKGASLMSY